MPSEVEEGQGEKGEAEAADGRWGQKAKNEWMTGRK